MVRTQHILNLAVALTTLGLVTALPSDQHVITTSPGIQAKGPYQVRDELKKAEIIPTVIDEFLPTFLVNAEWSSSNRASLGNTLKPKKLQDAPSITLTPASTSSNTICNPGSSITYTIALTDPDAPSRDSPKWSEICHWIATGVSVSSDSKTACSSSLTLSSLKDIMPYKPPGPPEKTGKHRYVFLVFAALNGTTEPLNLTKPKDRQHWGYKGARMGVRDWSRGNGLIPIAANFIYAQHKKQ